MNKNFFADLNPNNEKGDISQALTIVQTYFESIDNFDNKKTFEGLKKSIANTHEYKQANEKTKELVWILVGAISGLMIFQKSPKEKLDLLKKIPKKTTKKSS